ncbi:protein of unknown function [Paraburkholderia kururiensis]
MEEVMDEAEQAAVALRHECMHGLVAIEEAQPRCARNFAGKRGLAVASVKAVVAVPERQPRFEVLRDDGADGEGFSQDHLSWKGSLCVGRVSLRGRALREGGESLFAASVVCRPFFLSNGCVHLLLLVLDGAHAGREVRLRRFDRLHSVVARRCCRGDSGAHREHREATRARLPLAAPQRRGLPCAPSALGVCLAMSCHALCLAGLNASQRKKEEAPST